MNGQVEVDRGRRVFILVDLVWSMQQKCGGQDIIVQEAVVSTCE